jgi:hypothetical protein
VVDTPDPKYQTNETEGELEGPGAFPHATHAPKTHDHHEKPNYYAKSAEYGMRALKTTWKGLLKTVNWIDSKGPLISALSTVVIAVLTGFYVHYSRVANGINLQTATAAKSAAETSQKELVRDNRPWLGTDHLVFIAPVRIVKIGPPEMFMLQAQMSYKYEIRNYGKDPALRTYYHAESVESRFENQIDARQDLSCQWADGELFEDVSIGSGSAIFPNDFLEVASDAPGILFTPVGEHETVGSKSGPAPDAAKMPFFVVGCVSYADQFFDITKTAHHTRFCFKSEVPLKEIGEKTELRRCKREIRAD